MLQLGTKAETLKNLYGKLQNAKVLNSYVFRTKEWKQDAKNIWNQIQHELPSEKWIVRSSALNEDTEASSQAGKFESVGDVSGQESFFSAVNTVIASFDDGNPDNQILVQPMLKNVKVCGVAFTMDPSTMGNYYVINYDTTGSTSAITSGTGMQNKLLYIFKGSNPKEELPEYIKQLYITLKELENLFQKTSLDVEFAVSDTDELYIFQVRPLCLSGEPIKQEVQQKALCRIEDKIKEEQGKKPFLCGKNVVYSVMTDWNPAEMIGIRPKQLAMSLYREIITDCIWAYQRDNYGYRNLRSFPLMVDFGGLPYIDVRVSFNSFVPAELEETISDKLVNYYMQRLAADPSKHDKVEFDIVFSCYTLDLPERIQVLREYDFSEEEIQAIIDALRNLTNQIIDHETGLWRKDYRKIEILENRYDEIVESDMGILEKIYWLLEDCKRYGTLPFAGLARAAFIAVQMLKSMVKCEILSEQDYQLFMNGINTVSSNLNEDYRQLSKQGFLQKYGHLRPGTYDITSKRYDESPETYFDWKTDTDPETKQRGEFRLSLQQMHKLSEILTQNQLNNTILDLMDFIKQVIEGREYGKFVFTRHLSKVLQLIGELGEQYHFSREDCAYINIQTVRELYMSAKDIEKSILYSIERGKEEYAVTKSLTLPPVILTEKDIWSFYYPDTEANFITLGNVSGDCVVIESGTANEEIADKILLIPSADPGYDWVFSHGIRGFITEYGGANSHMAIRAGELGIPAAIGVGEQKFEELKNALKIEIDAGSKKINILRKQRK